MLKSKGKQISVPYLIFLRKSEGLVFRDAAGDRITASVHLNECGGKTSTAISAIQNRRHGERRKRPRWIKEQGMAHLTAINLSVNSRITVNKQLTSVGSRKEPILNSRESALPSRKRG